MKISAVLAGFAAVFWMQILALGDAPAAIGKPAPSAVGKPAPSFVVTDVNGKKVLWRQFAGHAVFLNFFATWCPPCKLELPEIVKRYPQYKQRVIFLGLDQEETPDLVKPFLRQFSIPYQIGIDQGQVAGAYMVQALPQSVFIDKAGIVRAIWRGYLTPQKFVADMKLIANP